MSGRAAVSIRTRLGDEVKFQVSIEAVKKVS
jgi:hypothetical protein